MVWYMFKQTFCIMFNSQCFSTLYKKENYFKFKFFLDITNYFKLVISKLVKLTFETQNLSSIPHMKNIFFYIGFIICHILIFSNGELSSQTAISYNLQSVTKLVDRSGVNGSNPPPSPIFNVVRLKIVFYFT